MATTKKTDKKEETKKTATKKPSSRKKPTEKKERASTGVVDEFLNDAIGGTITEETVEEPKKKKTTSRKKKIENKTAEQQPTDEVPNLVKEDSSDANGNTEAVAETKTETVPVELPAENDVEFVDNVVDNTVVGESNDNSQESQMPEDPLSSLAKKWDNGESGGENSNGVAYPPKNRDEKPKNNPGNTATVESLRVNLGGKKPENQFTFVTTSMGVKYD